MFDFLMNKKKYNDEKSLWELVRDLEEEKNRLGKYDGGSLVATLLVNYGEGGKVIDGLINDKMADINKLMTVLEYYRDKVKDLELDKKLISTNFNVKLVSIDRLNGENKKLKIILGKLVGQIEDKNIDGYNEAVEILMEKEDG